MTTIRLLSEENFGACENEALTVLDKLSDHNQTTIRKKISEYVKMKW